MLCNPVKLLWENLKYKPEKEKKKEKSIAHHSLLWKAGVYKVWFGWNPAAFTDVSNPTQISSASSILMWDSEKWYTNTTALDIDNSSWYQPCRYYSVHYDRYCDPSSALHSPLLLHHLLPDACSHRAGGMLLMHPSGFRKGPIPWRGEEWKKRGVLSDHHHPIWRWRTPRERSQPSSIISEWKGENCPQRFLQDCPKPSTRLLYSTIGLFRHLPKCS